MLLDIGVGFMLVVIYVLSSLNKSTVLFLWMFEFMLFLFVVGIGFVIKVIIRYALASLIRNHFSALALNEYSCLLFFDISVGFIVKVIIRYAPKFNCLFLFLFVIFSLV